MTCSADKKTFDYGAFFDQKLNDLKTKGNYRKFANLERDTATYPDATHHPCAYARQHITVWCSNDYLGMSQHPSVVEALCLTAEHCGVSAGGTRNISGTSIEHVQLEKTLADWHGKEAALVFTSAYVANHTTLYTLGKMLPNAIIFSDERNHASMIRGILDSGMEKQIFRHNDVDHLEELLAAADRLSPGRPKIIAFESVYSMSGTIAPIEDIARLAKKYNALTYLDEVHAVGLYGDTGSGMAEYLELSSQIDIINGTFGKAIGVIGGYIAASATFTDFIRSYGAGFIFTTALPPAICAAVNRSIELLSGDAGTQRRAQHQESVQRLKSALKKRDVPFRDEPSHIVPVLIGDPKKCKQITEILLYSFNIYVQPINYPTVPWGEECLRLTPSPLHTEAQTEALADALHTLVVKQAGNGDNLADLNQQSWQNLTCSATNEPCPNACSSSDAGDRLCQGFKLTELLS